MSEDNKLYSENMIYIEDIVDSISTVMEGGSQAFASRSKFYDQYPK